jgi:radical SAM superfamily enzyme YgiQ (UPF0313 family)
VCIGEGETVWHDMLGDAQSNSLKPFYQGKKLLDLANLPVAKREIFSDNVYKWNAHLVQTTRGCPVHCAGCPVPHKEGTYVRLRPVDSIIADIKNMPYKEFYFTDDTVMLPGKKYQKYLLKIMKQTAELDIKIFLASTMMMLPDPQFYAELKKGGAESMYTVFGYDRNSIGLFSKDCTRDHRQQSLDLVRMVEDAGIHFFASFGIGFDEHDESTAGRILQFAHDARIDCAEFYIPAPFPGTPFGAQIEKENRVISRDYRLWNTGNVVFRPKNSTPEQVLEHYLFLWKEFFKNKEPEKTLKSFTVNES